MESNLEISIIEEEDLVVSEEIQDPGKRLDAALLSIDDPSKKSKASAGASKSKKGPAPKKTLKPTAKSLGKPIKKGGKSIGSLGSSINDAKKGANGKMNGDAISEEMDENQAIAALDIIDPDMKTIDEYFISIGQEDDIWNRILEVNEIYQRKDTRNPYIMSCKVLGIIPISSVIKSLESEEIKLPHRGIGAKGAQALGQALEKNTSVKYLDLSSNFIKSGGSQLGMSLSFNRFITYLDLSDNQLGQESSVAISEMISENSCIKSLFLRGNCFSDKEAEHIAAGLKNNLGIQVLDLSYNDIGDVGIITLGAALVANGNITELNLAWNSVRSKGFIGFFNTIKDCSSIQTLNLERNGVGEGSSTLSTLLSKNTSLTDLNLASNRIGDVMIQIISKSLETSSSLINLDLSNNLFTEKGAPIFLKAVLNNNSLRKLNIKGMRFTKESAIKIQELKNEKTSLKLID